MRLVPRYPEPPANLEADEGYIIGMADHELRTAIRRAIRMHGFEDARSLTAMYLNDEADRGKRR